jgi:hypothetical protein
MRAPIALALCCGALQIAPLAAQEPSRWGDELAAPTISLDNAAKPAPAVAWPAPPLSPPPGEVRAIYVNAWAFGGKRLAELVRLAEGTEVNAFVIDVKDDTGYLTYRSEVPTAIAIGANTELRARDTRDRLQMLASHGIHPIARIVVAKDPLLAVRKPAWAIQSKTGGLWHDRQGRAWVDAYNDSVWVYAAQLGAEAVRMGFAEVQYDYVRFPDEPRSRMATAKFAKKDSTVTARMGVTRGLGILKERTRALGVPFTIDVFGLTTSSSTDMGIGQWWEDLVTTADVVLPMVYPSHYYRGSYQIKAPNAEPYRIIRHAMQDAQRRSTPLGKTAEIRPYLQAFTLGAPHYTPSHVREQIRACEELGIKSWVLWNPRSVYDSGYFRRAADPRKPPVATVGMAPAPAPGHPRSGG